MSWYLYIVFSKIFDSFCTLLARSVFSKVKINAVTFNIIIDLIAGAYTIIYGLTQPNFGLLPGQSVPWLNLILMMFLYGFGSVSFYKSFSYVEASKISILSSIGTIAALISSTILLGEKLQPIQYIGGIIVLAGIIITSIKKTKFSFGKGELFCLLGSAAFGAEIANDKVLMGSFGVYFYLVVAYLLPALLLILVFSKDAKAIPSTLKAFGKKNILIYTALFFMQAILFFIGLNISTSASLVIILNLAGRVLTVALAILILKEHDYLWQKIAGTAIVVLGLIIIG